MANISARKKLLALYDRGVCIRFHPETGARFGSLSIGGKFPDDDPLDPAEIEVWIAPPNPHQREQAMREAQAARARAMLKSRNDEDSEEHLTAMAFLVDMSFDTLVDYLIQGNSEERTTAAMREVLALEEWKDMDELRDAMTQFDESGAERDDPEWASLMEADKRYSMQVTAAENRLMSEERVSLSVLARDELEKRALERRGEIVGSQAFIQEYDRRMKFYAVRDADNHNQLFFEKPDELAEADEAIQIAIDEAIKMFVTEAGEAKN